MTIVSQCRRSLFIAIAGLRRAGIGTFGFGRRLPAAAGAAAGAGAAA